ncbi:MAG TPA: hypothetical protein VLC91_16495, partial [Spongiibacteraceae bacterium]|nr:hypothetical protein [Spongiibacteraceae bacterium]
MSPAIDIPHYSALLDQLYQGPFETLPFQTFLDNLRGLLTLEFAAIIVRRPDGSDAGMQFMSGLEQPPTTEANAQNYYRRHDALDPLIDLPLQTVVTLDEVISIDKLEQTEYFQNCLAPYDLFYVAALDVGDAAQHRYALRLYRTRKAGNFDSNARALLDLLAPHLARALGNGVQRVQLDAERHFYAKAAFGRAVGSITLDEHGHIVQA